MKSKIDITASIVLFNEDTEILNTTIDSFLSITEYTKKLYLVDNTEDGSYKEYESKPFTEYIPIYKNIGFGAGHNKAISRIEKASYFHLILNPDVVFQPTIFKELIQTLTSYPDLAMIAPRVLFPDGSFQNACRRFPTIGELVARRIPFLRPFFSGKINRGEYKDIDISVPFFVEYLTGCFHLYKTEDLVKLGGFDERYFLYMEDVDICKRIDQIGKKKMYYPKEEIKHVLRKSSYKNIGLLLRHTISAIRYFNKWGY